MLSFKEEMQYLHPNSPEYLSSKTRLRSYLFGSRDNILARLDAQIARKFFDNEETPFRFLKGGDVLSDMKSSVLTLQIAMDAAYFIRESNDPDVKQAYELAKTFTVHNIYERRDEWKALCKKYRNLEFPISKQATLSLFRSLYVVQNAYTTIPFMRDYIEEFRRYTPSDEGLETSLYLKVAIVQLAKIIDRSIEDLPIHVPPVRNKMSSTGRKKVYDWQELRRLLDTAQDIDPDAKRTIRLSLQAIQVAYGLDCSSYLEDLEMIPEDPESMNGLEFLPKANAVSQNKGKVSRLVFAGNDLLDLALDPGMRVQKAMKKRLPSCMSSTKDGSESNYSYCYRKANKWRQGVKFRVSKTETIMLTSSMEGADSSNATERINGHYMFDAWKEVYDHLSDESKQKLQLTEEYWEIARQLICETPFLYQNDGVTEVCYTNGTAQGLPQSWDLLDWTTMLTILESYCEYFAMNYPQSDYDVLSCQALALSANMGDDGLYASVISKFFKKNLQRVSLPGVINFDKTEDEDSVGYAPFASAYVVTGNKAPKVLSNFRLLSMIRKLSDPYEWESTQVDKWDRYQIRLAMDTLKLFKETYNRCNRPMICDDSSTIEDYARFSSVEKIIRFKVLKDLLYDQAVAGVIREGTNIAPCLELAPSYRARNVNVENMFISADRMYVLLSENQLMSCYDGLDPVVMRLDEDLAEARELHFMEGIPWEQIELQHEDRLFHELMNRAGVSEKLESFQFSTATVLQQYHFTYEGYYNSNLVVSCSIREEVR